MKKNILSFLFVCFMSLLTFSYNSASYHPCGMFVQVLESKVRRAVGYTLFPLVHL